MFNGENKSEEIKLNYFLMFLKLIFVVAMVLSYIGSKQ